MRRRLKQVFAGFFVVVCAACSGPGGENSSSPDAGENSDGNVTGGTALEVQTTLVSGNPDLVTAVANPAGGLFVAGLTSDLTPYIASFDAALQPVWLQTPSGIAAPEDLIIDGSGRVVLSAGQGGGGQIVRFDQNGALVDGVTVDGAEPGKLLLATDGTIIASGGFGLDETLTQVWTAQARGESVTATSDGGFIFASATETDGGTTGTGVALRKVDAEGALVWRSYASPGPGIHAMVGVRELSDGRLLAAISNDAADTRNVASGSALVTFVFDASGQLEASESVRFTVIEGAVPLLSGGALDMVSRGDATFVGLVANSGGFGRDVRTQITVEVDSAGSAVALSTIGGGSAVGSDGDLYLMNAAGRLARARNLEEVCHGDTTSFRPNAFDAQTSFQPMGDAMPNVGNVEVSPLVVTAEAAPLPESSPSECGTDL